ncbi:MAG: hypothetical protein M3139_01675 [Bacteroidota bacterium]|nr:hypothetical protein [Bacteroidota bacterium]
MKYILLVLFACTFANSHAQKFALLDMHLANPIKYSNKVTSNDKFNSLFPVEKKMLPEFINTLKEIEKRLLSKEIIKDAKQYEMGCIKFTGVIVPLASGERIDYVVTSSCDNVKIAMHLCDAKLSRTTNGFFVKTWIKYITTNQK